MSMRSIVLSLSAVVLVGAAPGFASAQDALESVKTLYASAAYEDALTALGNVKEQSVKTQVEQYRAFCLIALGRVAEARQAIERVVSADPSYVPDSAEVSPRVQTVFAEVRGKMLPDIVKQLYSEAKAAFDAKNRAAAHAGFKKVVQLVDEMPEAQRKELADLRMVAAGFVDLSQVQPAEPAPLPASSTTSENGNGHTAPSAAPPPRGDTRGPIAIRQNLPLWNPTGTRAVGREYRGKIRVMITASGTVSDVIIVQPSFPPYDQVLLQAARQWQYQPALSNGRPVPSDKEIDVLLRPK